MVSLWSQVWLLVWIRYVSGKERKYRIWSRWTCYSFIVPEAQRLFCIVWQLFYKSSTIGQAVRNGDLCNRYCESPPKVYASFEVWKGNGTRRTWSVFFKSLFINLSGWSIIQLYFYPINSTQRRCKKSNAE